MDRTTMQSNHQVHRIIKTRTFGELRKEMKALSIYCEGDGLVGWKIKRDYANHLRKLDPNYRQSSSLARSKLKKARMTENCDLFLYERNIANNYDLTRKCGVKYFELLTTVKGDVFGLSMIGGKVWSSEGNYIVDISTKFVGSSLTKELFQTENIFTEVLTETSATGVKEETIYFYALEGN